MSSENNKILVILGMHRSGTSLTANWINACGLNLGDELYKASEHNPKGYFEDIDFLQLHQSLLVKHSNDDSGHENIGYFNLDNKDFNQLKELVAEKSQKYEQWGWKEPRTCLFIEAYKELLPNATFLVVYRDCKEVVSSLLKRQRPVLKPRRKSLAYLKYLFDPNFMKRAAISKYGNIWMHYNKNILESLKYDKNTIFTNYKDLVSNDKIIYDQLIQRGFKLKFVPFSDIYDPALINNRPNGIDITFNSNFQNHLDDLDEEFNKLINV